MRNSACSPPNGWYDKRANRETIRAIDNFDPTREPYSGKSVDQLAEMLSNGRLCPFEIETIRLHIIEKQEEPMIATIDSTTTDTRQDGKAWTNLFDQLESSCHDQVSLSAMWRAAGSPDDKTPERWVEAEAPLRRLDCSLHGVPTYALWSVRKATDEPFRPEYERVGDLMDDAHLARGYADHLDAL